jgi:Fic family protein
MKTNQKERRWIWENDNFPNFVYDNINLENLNYKFGQLNMLEKFINLDDTRDLVLDVLLDDAICTSAIEGEILQRSSVRSSINKILKLGFEDDYNYTIQSDSLIEVLVDAKTNKKQLDKKRLLSWHKSLFPHGNSGLREINIGLYRNNEEDMQIVSGAWNKEKVHYIAPASKDIERLMAEYLEWLNKDDGLNSIYKAIIAHLYFVLIHPFDDGNGRIARAITDYILAQSTLANVNFYSVSTIIYQKRKEYYAVLDSVCVNKNQDINPWVKWFITLLESSVDDTLIKIQSVNIKYKFWNKHINTKLNDRQKKVILKMLSYLPNPFEGGMKVQKYMNITKTIRVTASRDLADLVDKNVMQSHGKGRGVYYILSID